MPFQPAPGIIRADVNQRLQNEPLVNVLHFRPRSGSVDIVLLEELATTLLAAWQDNIMRVQSNDLSLISIVTTNIGIEGGSQVQRPLQNPPTGLINARSMPANVAICATLRTPRVGRSYRGRMYLASPTETQVDGNFLEPVSLALWNGAVEGLFATFNDSSSNFDMVVLSRQNQLVVRPVALAERITSISLRNGRVDSQRRRLPRG